MQTEHTVSLRGISHEGLTVADPAQDVRGRKVVDVAGQRLSRSGENRFLVPVDAITSIDDNAVHVNQTRDHVAGGPRYDLDLMDKPDHLTTVYDHYGFLPFWSAGYAYPGFPYYP